MLRGGAFQEVITMRKLKLTHNNKPVEIELSKVKDGIHVFVSFNDERFSKTFPRKKNPKCRISQLGNLSISFRRTKHSLCLKTMKLKDDLAAAKKQPKKVSRAYTEE